MSSRALVLCGILFLFFFAATASQAQIITSVTPMSGVSGTQITITGQGLHPSWNGILGCTINGLRGATPTVWTDTEIVVTIPSNLPGNTTTIPIAVYCWDKWDDYISNAVNWEFSVCPRISDVPSEFRVVGMGCGGSDNTPCESTEVPFVEVHGAKEYQYKELAPTIHWQRSSECSLTRYLLNNKNAKCD